MNMRRWSQFPPVLLTRAIGLCLFGRVRWGRTRVEAGPPATDNFVAFRKIVVKPSAGRPAEAGAVLTVRLHFRRFSLGVNKLLSLIPIPFIVAQRGFRSKTWMAETESGLFQGLYEWDTCENARDYEQSLPLRLMKKRAVPESLVFEVCAAGSGHAAQGGTPDTP